MRPAVIAAFPLLLATTVTPTFAGPDDADPPVRLGHSAHGEAFDEGPRQKPWRMEGIGESHFPITTSVPEVQEWFDQGNTLLHNFWYFEAERSFRWCLKLDPDCAMAYWGLARATDSVWERSDRMLEFLREAVKRMDSVTDRERMYIEAWAKAFLPEFSEDPEATGFNPRRAFRTLAHEIEMIILAYPDDDEAKALFALASLFNDTRYGNEAVIREIIASNPQHPGAHHYRIHTWDGEEGAVALESCETYGRLAWASGHANHMPGHIYSGIGMWHEGAIWMDSATRVEKRYMEQRMTLPFHNWNYAHNRNYLCFIQEQLGLPSLAIDGARQLLAAPLDPKYNALEDYGVHSEGRQALVRALIKFERWPELLDETTVPWGDGTSDRMWRSYAAALAHLANGDLVEAVESRAAIAELQNKVRGGDGPFQRGPSKRILTRMLDELAGRIALAKGQTVEGTQLLARAAAAQWENYREENDPPEYPHLLYTVLGEVHLENGSPGQAALCFEKSIEVNPNDGFALAGLARARHELGDDDAAAAAYGRLLAVWSDAEPGLRWMSSARSLGLDAEPVDDSPKPQRNYRAQTLDTIGPETWRPYAAPALDALDAERSAVTLDEYEGRAVLLVFYLGQACIHCVEQLQAIGARADEFASRDVELLAISSDTPESHAETLELADLPFRLLSDTDHVNARRFHSYDDFEEAELHSTILIDGDGRIRWARTGGDPFMDLDFLLGEIDRVIAADEAGDDEDEG
jgi:peroxiredoxin